MRRYILLLALMVCVSCGPTKVVTESQRDTMIHHVVDSVFVRDTIVMAQIPEESYKAILPDSDTSYLRTSLAESEAYVLDGRLHHLLRNRSDALLPVKVQYVDRARTEQSSYIGWRQIIETVEVEKELSRWQSFVMSLGYGLLVALLIWIARKITKFFI